MAVAAVALSVTTSCAKPGRSNREAPARESRGMDGADEPRPARPPSPEELFAAEFPVTPDELFAHVAYLADDSMRGRRAGSAEELRAAEYVAGEFKRLGLEPAMPDGSYLQKFAMYDNAESVNVLGWLPGEKSDQYILIGAHIDHVGVDESGAIYNGADDNASGVAALIGIAKAWRQAGFSPRHSILLAGFGAEEQGLQGSRHYAEHPLRPLRELRLMINLDMLSRPRVFDYANLAWAKSLAGISDGPGVGLLGGGSQTFLDLARCSARLAGLPSYSPADFPILESVIEEQSAGRGDFAPFEARDVPYIFFSTSEHDDYHKPSDTIDKVDKKVLWRIAGVAWRTAMAVDAGVTLPAPCAGPKPSR